MREVLVGEGDHLFTWQADWAKLPAGKRFGYTHGVCEDQAGRIYIHNQSPDAVAVFDPDGAFITSWGAGFAAGAHGLHYSLENGAEFLYLCDIARHIVVKSDLNGEEVWRIETPMESGVYATREEFVPTNATVAPNGDVYVADGYGKSYIHHYTNEGRYLRTWGGPGAEPGQTKCPHGIHIDTRGPEPKIAIADRGNARLQYFTLQGEHLGFITHDLLHPCHFSQRGETLLIPDLFGRITLFNATNDLIGHLGVNPGIQKRTGYPNLPPADRIPGQFISPHAATWDSHGNIYVVEWIEDGRVTKLVQKGSS